MKRNMKTCVICGKLFPSPPSSKTVTCSAECRRSRARNASTGRKYRVETREKLSEKAKERGVPCDLQAAATKAAKNSAKSGRFKTNVNAIDGQIVSPEGKHYKCIWKIRC